MSRPDEKSFREHVKRIMERRERLRRKQADHPEVKSVRDSNPVNSDDGTVIGMVLGGITGGPHGALVGGIIGGLFDDD